MYYWHIPHAIIGIYPHGTLKASKLYGFKKIPLHQRNFFKCYNMKIFGIEIETLILK